MLFVIIVVVVVVVVVVVILNQVSVRVMLRLFLVGMSYRERLPIHVLPRTSAPLSARQKHLNWHSYVSLKENPDGQVNELNAYKRNDHTAQAIDQQIAAQQRACTDGLVCHTTQGQRNKDRDDDGIKDHCR